MTSHVLVFTDPSEDADDQISLAYLHKKVDLTIVVCGATHDIQFERLNAWNALAVKLHIWDFFALTLDSFKINHAPFHYDAILQISPLFGFDSEHITTDKYILMGTMNNSVNCPRDSVDLFRRFEGKESTIVIKSAKAATMRPTKKALEHMHPVLVEEIITVGFRLLMSRCSPKEVYAEGLINDSVGRGANYTSIENLYQSIFKRPQTTFCVRKDIDDYIDSLYKKTDKIEETRIKMYKMYKSLEDVFGIRIPVFTSETFVVVDKLESAFRPIAMEHCEILNPMYDFYAAWVLLNGLDRDNDFINSEYNICC